MSNMSPPPFVKNYLTGYKHHWIYTDHDMPVMIVARYEQNGIKTYRQFHLKNGSWVEGMPSSPYPLFGLHTLKNFSPFYALIITEGEKVANVLHQLNWPSISSVLGAQNPSSSDWNPIRYFKRFIILRDNDKSGISFTRSISTEIRRVCPDAEIFVINLTPGITKGDLIEWLQKTVLRGHSWNGFDSIPSDMIEAIKCALQKEIESNMIKVEDCQEVAFKPEEALFEGLPRTFQLDLLSVPKFPLNIFPKEISDFLDLISHQFSQVPDYASTAFIALLSGLIGRSIHLQMRKTDSWIETVNSWSVLIGSPSAKKSPIMRRIFKLFTPLEIKAGEEFNSAIKDYKKRKREAEKGDDDFDETPPERRRYITDDVTTPKLRNLMLANPNGIILRNDELKGQLERLDKQGNEGDRSFFMSCWSGLEVYSEDRMCRESLINIPIALTWIGCIPPESLQRYLREAMGRGSGADGLMQRFQFICYPDKESAFKNPTKQLPKELETQIQELIIKLNDDSRLKNRTLCFDEEAQVLFDAWLEKHENETRSGDHPIYWESHLGKQAKALAVSVIILHKLKEALSGKQISQVNIHTLKSALEVQKYFLSHARRCYNSILGSTVCDAESILNLFKKNRLPRRFKAQDIYHYGLGGLQDSARVRAALDLLEDYNWLVKEKIPSNPKGGRKHEFWILHPRAFQQ